jgi:hypothetical protein
VITNPGEAIFWSGRTNGVGGMQTAADVARNSGGKTLEQLIESRQLTMPAYNPNNPASVQAWQDISTELARNASGEVRVVLGNSVRPQSIWEVYELPALKGNTAVTRIVAIDPLTKVETLIFRR